MWRSVGRRHGGEGDPLAPLDVVDADHRASEMSGWVRYVSSISECRHLLAAGLDDVDRRPPEQPVAACLVDADVAGAEPAVDERLRRAVGPLPVSGEHLGSADEQLAGLTVGDVGPGLVDDAHVDVRHRLPDVPGHSTLERVGQDHAELGHPVALEEGVPGQPAPLLERGHRRAADPDTISRIPAALADQQRERPRRRTPTLPSTGRRRWVRP